MSSHTQGIAVVHVAQKKEESNNFIYTHVNSRKGKKSFFIRWKRLLDSIILFLIDVFFTQTFLQLLWHACMLQRGDSLAVTVSADSLQLNEEEFSPYESLNLFLHTVHLNN